MGQYTNKVNETLEIITYLEEGKKCNALEASHGRLVTYYNHGGQRIEFLRDNIEYNGVYYNKGQTIDSPPTDDLYIKYNNQYNTKTFRNNL